MNRPLVASGLLISLLAFAGMVSADLPQFQRAIAVHENGIDTETTAVSSIGVSSSSGGVVSNVTVDGQSAVLVASFGQPFAGTAMGAGAEQSLIDLASDQYRGQPQSGARFLDEEDIIRRGLIDPEGLENLTGLAGDLDGVNTYDESLLIEAEANFRKALLINPFNVEAAEGAIRARLARVLKANLVWDFRQKEFFITRYTDSEGLDLTGRVLSKEIAGEEENSQRQRAAISLLLDLFSDPLFRGPGDLLRGAYAISGSEVAADTFELLFSTGQRFASSEIGWGEKSVQLNFFNQGMASQTDTRASVADRLANSQGYLTGVMQLVNPFIDMDFAGSGDLLKLSASQGRLAELMTMTSEGYNPWGFVPDFVPFLSAESQNNNLFTYNRLKSVADSARVIAREKEQQVEDLLDEIKAFSTTANEYALRIAELEVTYESRLKSLAGVAVVDGQEVWDRFTFLVPDRDLDGDGVLERDKARMDLMAEGISFGAKGQVSDQYRIIEIAETRSEQAFNETQNVVRRMELREREAREISEVLESEAESIFLLIKENAEKTGLLIRQKARLQAKAQNRAARKQKRRGMFGGWLSTATGIATGNPIAIFSGITTMVEAGNSSSRPGAVTQTIGKIDAQIAEIQALERAEITVTQMEAQKEQLLIKAKFAIAELALSQANLGLDYYIAERDVDREVNRLSNILGQVKSTYSDFQRLQALLTKNEDNLEIGWADEDVRDVLTNEVIIADEALNRAKVWTFVALRSLEYYANKPPQSNGQPNSQILSLYKRLYFARKTSDLAALLNDMDTLANTDFVFTIETSSCPNRGLLSLKYDILAPTPVLFENDGVPAADGVNGEETFRYRDVRTGTIYAGREAYQAMFRDALREGLSEENGVKTLRLVFGTDLYPPKTDVTQAASNPFYVKSATNAKVIGFANPNCSGVGVPNDSQGIQVNLTGNLNVSSPFIKLAQRGNSYLKHTAWENEDFDSDNRLIDPLKNLTVYSSYEQVLPSWLITDVDPGSNETEERIGSDVVAVFQALRNGQGPAGKALSFTDRSVANDRWELKIEANESADNFIFLNRLEQMLQTAEPDPSADFLTDIQLWIGWNYRNPN